MERYKKARVPFSDFTVNKCEYCHKPIMNSTVYQDSIKIGKKFNEVFEFFCSKECFDHFQIQKQNKVL